MNEPIIQLVNASRDYDSGKIQAVKDVSLDIFQKEFIAILGRSGSGKTTILNLISGLDYPSSGSIKFENEVPETKAKWCSLRSSQIGFIFQSFNLIPTLTVIENIQVPMFGTKLSSKKRELRAEKLLDEVGLAHRRHHLPHALSGGERQRVAIARSLANKPSILLADEPTGNLDTQTAKEIMELIIGVCKSNKSTLVLVTHDERLAQKASRIVRMVDGCMIFT